MVVRKRRKERKDEGTPDWMLTYGDMTTLLLTFFVMMFTTAEIDGHELRMILAAFQGLGVMEGGTTLQAGKLAELGNNFMTLPSMERGKALDKAKKLAISIFQPEILSETVRVKEDERGLVISLSAETFFKPASAEIDIEKSRSLLQRIAGLLSSEDLKDRIFRLEGHTDSMPTDPEGPYPTNWELSVARSINVLKYLVQFGVNENQFQVAGYSDNVPYENTEEYILNLTDEARSKNRRVDIVILTEGHL
jgi:chemotaxis protein MotB